METPLYVRYDSNRDVVVDNAVKALQDFGRAHLLRSEFYEAHWPKDLPYSENFVGGDPPSVRLLHYQNSSELREYFEKKKEDVFGLDVTDTFLETDFARADAFLLTHRENLAGRGNVLLPNKAVLVMTRHWFKPEKGEAYNAARAYVLAYRSAAALPLDKVPFCQEESCVLRGFGEDFETALDHTVTRYIFEKRVTVCETDQRALRNFEARWDIDL